MKYMVKDERPAFYTIQNEVLDHFGHIIGPNGIAVYNALCRFASREGTSFPSLHKIATLTGMSRPTVVKYLKVLKEHGLIDIETRKTDVGDSDSNWYTIKNISSERVVNDVNHPGNEFNHGSKTDLLGVVNDVNTNKIYLNNNQLPIQQPRSRPGQKKPNTKERGDVHTCWQKNIPGTLTPLIAEQLDDLIDGYGPDALIHAITVAVNANIRTMRYVKGVLEKGQNDTARQNIQITVQRIEGEN